MATPTRLSVSNVALPNTADSGSVSITIPTGANACRVAGTYYAADSSVPSSVTGSAFAATTNGALRVNNPSSGAYMGHFSVLFKVTATGSQTIRVQKTGGYSEGPTCQIIWYTVDDPDNFVPTGGHLVAQPTGSPQALALTVNSNTTDLADGMFGTDGSSADPSAPTGTTQQGTMQTTQFDKQIVFSVNSPGASTTTVTVGSRDYPAFSLSSLRGSSGPTPTNYTLTCDVGSYSLTGIAALLRRGYSIVANVGSYAITGQNALLRRGYSLVCATGSYAITGYDATLTYVPGPTAYSLTCDVGSYSLTGYDATLTYGAGPTNYSLSCDVGAYSITGYDATLTYSAGAANYSLSCDVGAYALTGIDATLTYTPGTANYTLTCDTGSYALTGVAATLSAGRRLVLDTGSYAITGQAATLVYGRRLICATGSYSITGYDADLIYTTTGPTNYSLACDRGTYSLTGSDAALTYVDGSAPVGSPHGFVISDTAPKLWWQRKPKALDEQEAAEKVAKVVRVVERIARQQVEAAQPVPAKEQKREVREAIAPLVAEMPGFDWMTLYRTILIELGRRQQEQQAAELAQMEIARIQAMRRDEDDVLLLLMSI